MPTTRWSLRDMLARKAVLGGLIVVLAATNTYALFSRRDASARTVAAPVNPFPYVSPLRALIPQQHFLTTLEPLRAALGSMVADHPLRASVYVEYLNTGANIAINEHARYWPASLAKVPMGMAMMKAIERGVLSLDDSLAIGEADRTKVSSDLGSLPAGTRLSIRELYAALLTASDNTAYNVMLRALPDGELEAMRVALGLDELFDAEGRVSAKEFARILRALYYSSYLSSADSQFILDLLTRSKFSFFLAGAVPSGIPVAHKWGAYPADRTYGDAGIVYLPHRPYLIVILVQGATGDNAQEKAGQLMRETSRLTYDFFLTAR